MIYKVTEDQYNGFVKLIQREADINVSDYINSDGVADLTMADNDVFNTLLRRYGLDDDIVIVPTGSEIKSYIIKFEIPISFDTIINTCSNIFLVRDIRNNHSINLAFDAYFTHWDKNTPTFSWLQHDGIKLSQYDNMKRNGSTMTYLQCNGKNNIITLTPNMESYLKTHSVKELFEEFDIEEIKEIRFMASPNLYKKIFSQLANAGLI